MPNPKLTLSQLAAMVAQEADPTCPALTKRLNGLVAAEEMTAEEASAARAFGNPVAILAERRAAEAEEALRARGIKLWG